MNTKLATTCFAISVLLGPLAAHAGDTDRAHPLTFVKDSVITAKIKAMLADEKMNSLAHIKVDTDSKGEVVLRGKVHTQAEADKAVSIARGIEGVTSVTSSLHIVQAASPQAAHADTDRAHPITFVKDSVVTTKVKAMLADEKMGTLAHVHVDTDNKGAVVLSGTARTQEAADKAVSIARATGGVTSVTSQIQIKKDD